MQAVVGLGNPGFRYCGTRHNLGFRVVELLAEEFGGRWAGNGTYLYSEVDCRSSPVVLVKPTTYVNGSGSAVAEVAEFYGIGLGDVMVVLDDVHRELGCLRFRRSGTHGGHNGLRSIIDSVRSTAFPRLRIGIGIPPEGEDYTDHVLGAFTEAERKIVVGSIRTAASGVACWLTSGIDEAMNRYNA